MGERVHQFYPNKFSCPDHRDSTFPQDFPDAWFSAFDMDAKSRKILPRAISKQMYELHSCPEKRGPLLGLPGPKLYAKVDG